MSPTASRRTAAPTRPRRQRRQCRRAALTLENDLITGGRAEVGGGVDVDEGAADGPLARRSSGNAAGFDAGSSIGGRRRSLDDRRLDDRRQRSLSTRSGGLGGSGPGHRPAGRLDDRGQHRGRQARRRDRSAKAGGSIVVRNSTIAGNVTGAVAGGLGAYANAGGSVSIEDDDDRRQHRRGRGAGGLELSGAPGTISVTDTIVADNTGLAANRTC